MAGATSRVVQWREMEVSIREIPMDGLSDNPKGDCTTDIGLIFAGHGRTNAGGSWTVDLAAIACFDPRPGPFRPSVTATPTTEGFTDDIPRPYILVVRTQGSRVTIWSFDVHGELAENVEFSWHAIVEVPYVG